MKKKNPWVAAILNFLFPGIGFAYMGSAPLILGGVVLIISFLGIEIIYVKYTAGMAENYYYWFFLTLLGLSLAVITFALTKIYNRSIQAQDENLSKKDQN